MSDFESAGDDDSFDLLETLNIASGGEQSESAETLTERAQTLREIEIEVQQLPARQREAFLMRYWEDMDVAETPCPSARLSNYKPPPISTPMAVPPL